MKAIITAFFVSFICIITEGADFSLSGVYQGKNLFVQNPFVDNSKDFCVEEVFVNNLKVLSKIESSAFEIDLSGFKLNDPVPVKLVFKDGCNPKILNPHVIKSNIAFGFTNIKIDDHTIAIGTKGENPQGKFFLEHFLNGVWIAEKEFHGKGSGIMNAYDVNSSHNSGLNRYRVKYMEHDGTVYFSNVVEYQSSLPAIDFYPKRITDKIFLNRESEYEVLDNYGNLKLKGKDSQIDMTKITAGVYYLNTDNKSFKIYKK